MKKLYFIAGVLFFLGIISVKAQYTNLHNFNDTAGSNPDGSLTLSGHVLYGMTSSGGANTFGCIFSVNTNGSGYTDIHDFNLTAGAYPNGSLILSGNVLYGMTNGGGTNGFGCVFSINTNGSNYRDLWDFDDTGSNGATPFGTLTLAGNVLYGMTWAGGRNGDGNVFSIHTDGNFYTDLFDFNGTNGMNPYGDLTLSGNILYGMTQYGGINSDGNIFSIDTNGGSFTDLFDLSSSTGNNPAGDLILAGNVLYGMSESGGTYTDGNVFSIHTDGNFYTDLLDFNSINGYGPYGSLILSGNVLYGMTTDGGIKGDGNLFSIDTTGSGYINILNFDKVNGQYPYGSLIYSGGVFYGMTQNGGIYNDGVIFGYSPCTFGATAVATSNVLCNGQKNGNAMVTPIGGSAPFTYSWSNGGTTAVSASNPTGAILGAGTYTVTIIDSSSCTATAAITITQPAVLTANMGAPVNASCTANDGNATVTPNGGTSPYAYTWTPNGGTNATGSGFSAGTYTVSVRDNNGCSASASVSITQPVLLSISENTTNVSCSGGGDGNAVVKISSGISPFTYSWSTGATTDSIFGLSAGNYTVSVSDSGGCNVTASVNITQPRRGINVNAFPFGNVTCYGDSNGSAFSFANGGTAPYTYLWEPGGSTSANPTTLSAGTSTLTVTDSHGCTATTTINLTQPATALAVSSYYRNSNGVCDGFASVTASGGTPPYTYAWSGGQTYDTIQNQCPGTYCCTVTDNNGCTNNVCGSIVTGIDNINNAALIHIYPDPNKGEFTIDGVVLGQVVEVYDFSGQLVNRVRVDKPTLNFNISNMANGVYLIRVENKDGSAVLQRKIVKTL